MLPITYMYYLFLYEQFNVKYFTIQSGLWGWEAGVLPITPRYGQGEGEKTYHSRDSAGA